MNMNDLPRLITPGYIEQNRELHKNELYGTTGHKHITIINDLIQELGTRDVLDYGCGKRTLEQALGYPIANYDPAIEGVDSPPSPHAIVVCSDVLEHIEPECLMAVLQDLRRLAKQALFGTIATRAAYKTLPDGRNAHLIIENQSWWLPKLWEAGFSIRGMVDTGRRIKFTAI